ncbi:MAG: bifunctional demethylmenaquinone methyltransferase/2-methoxy-6-polyprenyl-1,4-benzoquinol methylase UbiE [Bauldia sp.]|nr:bifunctional demethylmenaquinone methyltransferase/2-methoxy-6-polyprenyl-1,4-benzoquinol methylase UbiE [Bauldia sp.]
MEASDKQGFVDGVFHQVAARYDLMNDLMSGGLHRAWKDALVNTIAPPKAPVRPWRALDIAGGTGDIAFRVAEASGAPAEITILDINASMLDVARARAKERGLSDRIRIVEANAEKLPFESGTFDAATSAFGLRNVPDLAAALREAHRVLRPGSRLAVLEFSHVDVAGLDRLYDLYSFNVIPELGRAVVGEAEPYRYLVESIRRFPNQERFAAMLRTAGFERVTYRNLSGGIVAIHSGWKL